MLAIRQFFAGNSRASQGDYDALPLTDLGHNHPDYSPDTRSSLPPRSPGFTARKVILTILSTTLTFIAIVATFSLFDSETTLEQLDVAAAGSASPLRLTGAGGFYRDAYPIRNMIKYWEIAEEDVKEKGLDTCNGQLSRELIDAYARSAINYCHPPVSPSHKLLSLELMRTGLSKPKIYIHHMRPGPP